MTIHLINKIVFMLSCLQSVYTSTVIIYSATGGGFSSAIAASRAGASVTLLSATGGGGTGSHIGGMVTGGLQHTDCGNASVIGGIAREFFTRVELQYPNRSTDPNLQPCTGPPCWLFEAHVAERVMYDMLSEANVNIVKDQVGIDSVVVDKTQKRLVQLKTTAGLSFVGDIFIDASYEGDLLSAAGATMTFGRESSAHYNEKGAGVRPIISYDQMPPGIDPFWPSGEPIPLITTTEPFLPVGSADDKLESFSYRLCMTRAPSRRVPITKPSGYNSSTFELFRRMFAANPGLSRSAFLACLGPIPSVNSSDCPPLNGSTRWCKCDMISGGALGTDFIGGSFGYANASISDRQQIAQQHAQYVSSVVWFLMTDSFVPESVRTDMSEYGLCADEFSDTIPLFFPHQLYVREARRLVGDFVLTQNPPSPIFMNRSIGLGSYQYDAHSVQRGIQMNRGKAEVVNEGEIVSQPPAYQPSYRIPYDTLLPSRVELVNVLAAVPVSASHVVFTSLRMEPTWMIMGHAAGVAAALASKENGGIVQDVNVRALQELLVASGQLITE
jgi:hypothetical protein